LRAARQNIEVLRVVSAANACALGLALTFNVLRHGQGPEKIFEVILIDPGTMGDDTLSIDDATPGRPGGPFERLVAARQRMGLQACGNLVDHVLDPQLLCQQPLRLRQP